MNARTKLLSIFTAVFWLCCATCFAQTKIWAEGKDVMLTAPATLKFFSGKGGWVYRGFDVGVIPCTPKTFGVDRPLNPNGLGCLIVPVYATCMPYPYGWGTKHLIKWDANGCFIAWRCKWRERPVIFAATTASGMCSIKSAFAQKLIPILASPTDWWTNNLASEYVSTNVFTDPAMLKVWQPYAAEIDNLWKSTPGWSGPQ